MFFVNIKMTTFADLPFELQYKIMIYICEDWINSGKLVKKIYGHVWQKFPIPHVVFRGNDEPFHVDRVWKALDSSFSRPALDLSFFKTRACAKPALALLREHLLQLRRRDTLIDGSEHD